MKQLILIVIIIVVLFGCKNSNNLSDAYGNFEAKEIMVSSEANGKLLSYSIDEGITLKKGVIVGIVDTIQLSLKKEQLISQLGLLNAKYESISSQIEVQKTQKENLLREKNRVEKLLNDGAATSKQMDDITGQIAIIDKQIKSVQTQFLITNNEKIAVKAQIKQIDDQLKRCKIINPIDGTVLENYVESSELVTMGRNLYKIADLNTLDLRVYVSGSQLPHIAIGQKVNVLFDENKKKNTTLEGEIKWISSSAEFTPKIIQTKEERVNLVYAVLVKVKNDGSLKIGMPGEVVFSKAD